MKINILRNYSKSNSKGGIYILSAVRTPFGFLNGVLSEFTAPQLGSFAVKEACQRAAVPSEDLQNVFLGCSSHNDCHAEIIKRTGLAKTINLSLVSTCSMKSLLDALKFVSNSNSNVCMAGGMESMTHLSTIDSQFFKNFVKSAQEDTRKLIKSNVLSLQDLKNHAEQDFNNFIEANKNGAFCDEILKIDFTKKGQQIVVDEDEILRNQDVAEGDPLSALFGDGAAAIILSTEDYFKNNNLVPLVKVISFEQEFAGAGDMASAQLVAIEKALKSAECTSENIATWEIVSVRHDTILNFKSDFSINVSEVNKDGGFRYPLGISGVSAVCHLVHSLSTGELGCAACCDVNGTAAVVVKKLSIKKSSKPELTLYTKHPCPLCDELKQQLKPFEGRFSLVEVDIESKENEKYKELYQYEIPVLFLDGIFLCKHRLNVEHFSRRLLAAERAA